VNGVKQVTPTLNAKPPVTPGHKQVNPTIQTPPTKQTGMPYLVPSKTKQGTPALKPVATSTVKPTASQPATHNGVKQVTPTVKPVVTSSSTSTAKVQGTSSKVLTPIPHGQSSIPTKINASTDTATPGFFDRMKNYFKGDQKKIIEPGIHNKEVEAYRTNDAKEVEYKDTIIQDDKNVTLPKKHLK
jgi:hypothetical protein